VITRSVEEVAAGLARIAEWLTAHPGHRVTRSRVRNLSLLDADGVYVGWADPLTGDTGDYGAGEPE
jgi:hypothetical protein